MIKAVVFDFAGVIGTEGYWLWLAENIPNLKESEQYFLHISHQVDKGDITEQQFVAALSEKSGKPLETIKKEIFGKIHINGSLLAYMQQLRKTYKVGLLTNFVEEWITEILTNYQLHDYFDSIVVSSQEKMIKPDAKIFQLSISQLKVAPEEAVFVDDRQTNVDGAKAVGMHGVLFKDTEQLKNEFQTLGLSTE